MSDTVLDINSLSPEEGTAELIRLAAEKTLLKKAVFSKPADASIVKTCAMLKLIGKRQVLQLEYFMSDNKRQF